MAVFEKAWGSEPTGLVDKVAQRLVGEKMAAIVEDDLPAAVVETGAAAGGVRRQRAGQGPQFVVGGQRLLFEDLVPARQVIERARQTDRYFSRKSSGKSGHGIRLNQTKRMASSYGRFDGCA